MKVYDFMNASQTETVKQALKGEEREYFKSVLEELSKTIETMPVTYEQDGKGYDAVAYLHYFKGGCDIYVTEKDMEEDQEELFGLTDLGYGGELGYIPLKEVLENGFELDFHFTPKTLKEVTEG